MPQATDRAEPAAVSCTAFEGSRQVASGTLDHVAAKAKAVIDRGERAPVLIFDDATSEIIDVDFRGTLKKVLERIRAQSPADSPSDSAAATARGPGRPKLGVVAREVTLLPRHWDWLNSQPSGASVALRKLVDDARTANAGRDRARRASEAAYRFMSAMAGDWPGFEEATRALFAWNRDKFDELVDAWPAGVRDHIKKLAAPAFDQHAATGDSRE